MKRKWCTILILVLSFLLLTGFDSGQETAGGEEKNQASYDFTLCFAGDINLDESWATTQMLDRQEGGIYACISQELIEQMKQADIMCLNNEYTYSERGKPLPGKAYTFRANPSRVEVLKELGVDLVTLANNHVYDYGPDALLDTLKTLKQSEIAYVGAGENLKEAMKPYYVEVQGKTIAFVAASRAEKNKMTPQATNTTPGILRCYDTNLFKLAIKEAREHADFVIALVHWGTEYSTKLEPVQLETGHEYIDLGADAVIGAHSHCLQGMELYNGKPIIYSLGNYWFNAKTLDTMLLKLHFVGENGQDRLQVEVVPAVQTGCQTLYASPQAERDRIFTYLEKLSPGLSISEDGIVSPK